MNQIEKCFDIVQKKELYLQLKDELLPHIESEKRTLCAHLIKEIHSKEAIEVAEHAEDRYKEITNLFNRLDNILIESDEWESIFRKLNFIIRKHVNEDEAAIFEEAKMNFSQEELIELGKEFTEIQKQLNH
jgi:hypothetical protein